MSARSRRSWLVVPFLAAGIAGFLPAVAEATGGRRPGLCATVNTAPGAPYLAIVSAYPAELAPLVAATTIEATLDVDGRSYYVGRLDGVRVVLGLTGIGLLNATARARSVLSHFDVAGLVMSGTAGTQHRIGDVIVASAWQERNRKRLTHVNPAMVALARRAAVSLPAPLEHCSPVPPTAPGAPLVCLPYMPTVIFGTRGQSDDPFGHTPLACTPGGGEIFGCELPLPASVSGQTVAATAPADPQDMETAAVARVAARRGVPFVGVRAADDGHGDPLGDRGFPTQFFDYYRLAAHNAGAVTEGVVAQLGRLARDPTAPGICRLLTAGQWRAAATRILNARDVGIEG
jgi:adenosylhomocysteine nucleosidase